MNDWAFVEHVTQQLLRPRPGDSKHPTLWPSEASATYINDYGEEKATGKCRRAIFFRYLIDCYKFYDKYKVWKPLVERLQRESKPIDKYMLWIWSAGELYEEYLIRKSKESGSFANEQVPVYIKSHNVSGKKDIEVINPQTHKRSIVEAKSVYGHGATSVIGKKPTSRTPGTMGEPRDSNLMQTAIYHWWSASMDDAYEESRLVYGARDTGRYAEYLVRTVEEEGTIYIEWKPHHPYPGPWKRSHITINSILDAYSFVQQCVDGGRIPERDFDIKYTDEQLDTMYERDEFGKTDREKYEKIKARKEENAWIESMQSFANDDDMIHAANQIPELLSAPTRRLLEQFNAFENMEGKYNKVKNKLVEALRKTNKKKELQPLEKGDWQCRYCKFAPICYNNDGEPQDIK